MSTLPTRVLGKSGLIVSEIGLGCMGLSFGIGDRSNLNRDDSIALIRHAFASGVTFFDTAECYGPHENEKLLGEAIATLPREKLVIATKTGIYMDRADMLDSSEARIRESIAGSLARLNTPYVDLYYIHRIDPKVPIEDVARTMLALKEEGKIRHWGLSEASADTIRRAHAVFPLTAVQSEYSLFFREVEQDIVPTLEELGIGLVPFSPLGRGLLTATVSADTTFTAGDIRASLPYFTKENIELNKPLVALVKEWAEKKNGTPAQVALAWLIAQKPFIAPIPGTTKVHRLEENLGEAKVHFTAEEMKAFNTALQAIQVHGERYGENQKKMLAGKK